MMIFINLFLFLFIGNSIAYDIIQVIHSTKKAGETSLSLDSEGLSNDEDSLTIRITLNRTELGILNDGSNYFGDKGVAILADYLKHSKFTRVNLAGTHISDRGVSVLAPVLNQTQIEYLSLYDNHLRYGGIMPIFDVLKHTLITELDLGNNEFGDEGAIGLAEGLIGSRITGINLQGNGIGDQGAGEIARFLNRTMITKLHLGWNKIGNQGARAIADVLNDTAITNLDIQGNEINSETVELFITVLNGTQVKDLGAFVHPWPPEVDHLCSANRERIERLYKQFEDFVVRENESLEFNAEKAYIKKTEYIDFAGMIADKKRIYGVIFSTEGRVEYPREQILDFFENIEIRLSECFLRSQFMGEQFRTFIRCNKNGSLEFELENAYINKSQYIEFAGIVGESKTNYIERFNSESGKKYNKTQIEEFVGNIETRLSECFLRSQFMGEQFQTFIRRENNGSLEFNLGYAYINKSEYIEFAGIVAKNKSNYIERFNSESGEKYNKTQIEDFVGNIETRLSNCIAEADRRYQRFNNESWEFNLDRDFVILRNGKRLFCQRSVDPGNFRSIEERLCKCFHEVDYVYRQFENCVSLRNGSFDFNIDNAYTNRSEYVEFTGIVKEDEDNFILGFKNRFDHTGNQILDFVMKIGERLNECFGKTDLVYRAFMTHVFNESDGPSLTNVTAEIVSNKQSFINYLVSRSDGFYSKAQVKEFIGRIQVSTQNIT